jgi:elongation factor Ts
MTAHLQPTTDLGMQGKQHTGARMIHHQRTAGDVTNAAFTPDAVSVLVEMSDASIDLAHDVAVHIAFARPKYLSRNDIPADVLEHERQTLETISRNEGKPEAALAKIVEGRINGFFKDVALLDQPYAKDDKQNITQMIGKSSILRFAQVEIG